MGQKNLVGIVCNYKLIHHKITGARFMLQYRAVGSSENMEGQVLMKYVF